MKKWIAVVLCVAMLGTMAGCGKQEPQTPAQQLYSDFQKLVDSGKYTGAEQLAQAMAEDEQLPFDAGAVAVEPGYLNGFTEDITGFTEGANFGPFISPIPFVGYVFAVDDNVDDFVQNLKDKSNLRWNVCTEADEMLCEAYEGYVFFVMAPADWNED